MIATRFSEHVGNELGGDGRSRFVLLILTGIEEMGNDGGDTTCRGNLVRTMIGFFPMSNTNQDSMMTHLAGMNHDT